MEKHWVHPEVLSTRFACDLDNCKGACCTFAGGSGAPVDPDELPFLREVAPAVMHYLPDTHRVTIREEGLFRAEGNAVTLRCVDDRACVFVMYDGPIAKCAIQHAYQRGEVTWIKPRSCHLFPIRVRRGRMELIEFEEFTECRSALERGRREDIPLVRFLEEPLRREFGNQWYEELYRTIVGRDRTASREMRVC